MGRLLGLCGYRVALYASADQLLATPIPNEPGCILLDVRMSGLSGPQLQDRLAQLGNPLPIIFVTGHGDIPTSVRAIKAGAEDFLTKRGFARARVTAHAARKRGVCAGGPR